MPLLSQLLENRSQSQKSRVSVRYCDSRDSRHNSVGNALCSYASPAITALVAEDLQHKRLRNGLESTHCSFNAIQNASLLLRINKRFESIDNDRQENIVDVLNDIALKMKDSTQLLDRVVTRVESEGTISALLQQICDHFKESLISESPQLESVAKNTSFIMDSTEQQVAHTYKLRDEMKNFCAEHMKTADKMSADMSQLVAIGTDIKDQIRASEDMLTESVLEAKEALVKNTIEVSAIKYELQMANTAVDRLEANLQMQSLDVKQELVDIKHEISTLREEVVMLREAIVDVLPNKLLDAFNLFNNTVISGQSSRIESDVEVIDGEETIDYDVTDGSIKSTK